VKHQRFIEIKSQRDLQAMVLSMVIKCADLGRWSCSLKRVEASFEASFERAWFPLETC
jgi:hypothetical protein